MSPLPARAEPAQSCRASSPASYGASVVTSSRRRAGSPSHWRRPALSLAPRRNADAGPVRSAPAWYVGTRLFILRHRQRRCRSELNRALTDARPAAAGSRSAPKPALAGAKQKQRKGVAKAAAKFEPEQFRDQLVKYLEGVPEGDFDGYAAKLDALGNQLDYRKCVLSAHVERETDREGMRSSCSSSCSSDGCSRRAEASSRMARRRRPSRSSARPRSRSRSPT